MAGGRSRRFYLGGLKRGEVRPSRRVRSKRRESEEWTAVCRVAGAYSQAAAGVTATEASSQWRLGRGYRDSRSGATRYAVGSDDERVGEVVVLDAEDVCSGRRWFRVPFPDTWTAEYTRKGREEKSLGCLEEYGKEFVEYEGRWYEAREVRAAM